MEERHFFVDHIGSFVYLYVNSVVAQGKSESIADIYPDMKELTHKKLFLFYLWVGLAHGVLWFLSNLSNFPGNFFPLLYNNFWRLPFIILTNFVFFEYTIPFVLRKKAYVVYNIFLGLFFLMVHMLFWSYGLYAWRWLGVQLHVYTPLGSFSSFRRAIENQMHYSASSVFFFGIIRHIYSYQKLRQSAQQLRIEKQEAELNYLRSQTNPHFLFNTLNNIYSLSRDKNERAPESILRLSKILRFMLYETDSSFIPVEQELKIMQDYIELEKLRYDASLQIDCTFDLEEGKEVIPPLLLMPLVENAFKHGVSETRHMPFVAIHLSIRNRQLDFAVRNSVESVPGAGIKENIGISNLRRQLELLYRDYSLALRQEASQFVAHLKINLQSHV